MLCKVIPVKTHRCVDTLRFVRIIHLPNGAEASLDAGEPARLRGEHVVGACQLTRTSARAIDHIWGKESVNGYYCYNSITVSNNNITE